jgi:GTP pyrophosphokinase
VKHDALDANALSPRIRRAVEHARALAPGGVGAAESTLAVLASLHVDEDVQLAGWLVPLLAAGTLPEDAAVGLCGAGAVQLAREHSRIGASGIPSDWNPGQALKPEQAERLRKLLLALASDVRLVLVRLAVQLATMRELKDAPRDAQRRAALETREIYAPLANRLGIWQLKWELEDLAFRYSEPEQYKRIAGWLRVKRDERERYIEDVRRQLDHDLRAAGIAAEIAGRPKHIYSIWRKMQRKGVAFEQVMDVLAVRVIVGTVAECYAALGLVHGRWPYIHGEFDDYIANPKENNYRSLHTAVIGPGQLPLEVQIRTREMHEHAELGVAAHWLYKEGGKLATTEQARVAWLRQLLEPAGGGDGAHGLFGGLNAELFEDRVYALSPKGEVVDLPKGATPLDFAYHVHTDLGHRCRGAKVNGRMVPLNHVLANGDSVEILAGKQPNPSRDWLVPALGYLASARNRAKVRGWFRKLDEGENREQGRLMLERELERLGVRAPPLPDILAELSLPNAEALYLNLGSGELSLAQVVGAMQRRMQTPRELPRAKPRKSAGARSGLLIDGVGDLMSTIARCCRPVPPEPIVGYVTLGRGVSIHRADCKNLLRLRDEHRERVLAVDWGRPGVDRTFPVAIKVLAYDRRGLVRDVSSVLADEKISIESMQTVTDARENTATIDVTVSVRDLDELSRLLARFAGLPNVLQARRVV